MGGAGTVGVAVVVAVTGSVAGGGGVGAVEDDGDVAVAAVVVETVDFGEHRAPEKAARITKRVVSATRLIMAASATISMGGQSRKM